ncbi:MAG: DsbA family protein [Acidiferrobacterales bacterium]
MSKPELPVTVFSDYICPFCYIGSVRLEHLRDEFDLQVTWASIEIHPENPEEGKPVEELGYPPAQWERMMAALHEMAKEEGVEIAERTFTTNSRKALLLSEAVKQEGEEVFQRLHDRLFEAYFGERQNIGQADVLRQLAHEIGVPDGTVERAWGDPYFTQRLQANHVRAARLGVTGTPTYLIGNRLVVGAVPTSMLRNTARARLAGGTTPSNP